MSRTHHQKELLAAIAMATMALLLTLTLFFNTPGAHAQSASPRASTNYASLVNPFTGTNSGGDTFPGADSPFGMVQWSPDTVNDMSGGYNYSDNRLRGFSLTHLSGAGCDGYEDIPFVPYVGAVTNSPATDPSQYYLGFSHSNETAYAGYYKVALNNGITTELTTTQRTGAMRLTYPAGQTATLLVNTSGSINGVSASQGTINGNTISGYATSGSFCGAGDRYTVYFYATFSQPFASYGTWQSGTVTPNSTKVSGSNPISPAVQQTNAARAQVMKGQNVSSATKKAAAQHPDVTVSGSGSGVYVTFNSTSVTATVGLSFVSVANAQANLSQEDSSGNFDTVLSQSTQTWNNYLGEVQVSGGSSADTATFYTAMYHSLLQPNVFSDDNGQYIGFDGQVHTVASGHAQYANYSGWDIYRSEAQLLAFLAPSQASDIAQSMVNDYAQSGMLPKWSLANGETYVMVGDPADGIIADIYAFGGTNFDTSSALSAMVKEATQANNVRPGLNYLISQGYEPSDGSYGCCNFYGPASTTLEYNTADFALAAFAQQLGNTADYQEFVNRAQDWENLVNTRDKYLEPRSLNGSFPSSFDPTSGTDWVEGDGAQYNWMVPFNLAGLFQAEGGNSAITSRLNTFFTQLNAGGNSSYVWMGNEPSVESPWEYDYAGAPYQTQKVVRQVETTLYSTGPNGMDGNDDLGEMASWYVWAAMGMFPETPGTANLALSSPLFPNITVTRPGGQTITISAPNASDSTYYVQSLTVNGATSNNPWLPPSFVANGGTLAYTLSTSANTSWGAAAANAPPSYGSISSNNGSFSTSFESGQAQPTWTNTVDSAGYPAGGLTNVGGICCGLTAPEMGVRNEAGHTGGMALMYSGLDNSATTSYAYMEVFDLSGDNLTVGSNTTLTYWIFPQSPSGSTTGANLTSGTNSSCVAIDLIFSDGTNLRDSGATDQKGVRVHPAYQCGHLTMDAWNEVVVDLGSFVNGKTIVRLDVGYDQPANTGGYRGYLDDISIGTPGNQLNNAGISDDSNRGGANFDNDGFSYSAQALAAKSFTPGANVTANGMTYTWPNAASGMDDNILAPGQTIPTPNAKSGASQLTFLGSSTNGPSTGTVTITYTDGSTQTAMLGFSDWTLNGGSASASYGNVIACQMTYRNSTSGSSQQITTYVFASASISLNTSKKVASISLPSSLNQGQLHVFAWSIA
jgi:predicted alpha-1,2-mannosidase